MPDDMTCRCCLSLMSGASATGLCGACTMNPLQPRVSALAAAMRRLREELERSGQQDAHITKLMHELEAERRKYSDLSIAIVEATGIAVPAGGMTALQAVRALRQRHAEAVEAAYREGYTEFDADPDAHGEVLDAAWLASEAKKGLT